MAQVQTQTNLAAFIRTSTPISEVLHVCGDIDLINEGEFRAAIDDLSASGLPIVVDLTKCTYIGSSGFHVLAACHDERGGIRVVAPDRIEKLLHIVGLSSIVGRLA